MNRLALAFGALLIASHAYAQPAINFVGLGWPAFNGTETDATSFMGIAIGGYTYGGGTTYRQDQGFLWLRNNTNDHGVGYCSEKGLSPGCGSTGTTGNGDRNEISNNYRDELVRLTLPAGMQWTDIQVSSLDDGGSNGNETGTLYWSNNAAPNLHDGSTSFINFSHDGLGWSGSTVEGSIFATLVAGGLDVRATHLFFRAGEYNGFGDSTNGSNNDYLVWGVGVAPIPEPETYALLLAGLGLLGFAAQRRRQRAAAAS